MSEAIGRSLCLGIDGGGTKTEFALVSPDGRVHKQLRRAGCNPNDIGIAQTIALLAEGIGEMLTEFPTLRNVFCGIAGITAGHHREELYGELTRRYPRLKIEIKSDAANLFALDDSDSTDMVVISGTGSVVFVRQCDGYARLGGWGYLLDRAGSAYDMGREAIRVALAEEDRGEESSPLARLLRARMGTDTVWAHVSRIYQGGKPYIASFASAVFEAYKLGDRNASAIIDETARGLASLLNQGVELYGVCPAAVASGGLFEHYGEILLPRIRTHYGVELTVYGHPPVYGACRTACKLGGEAPDGDFSVNFQKTYGSGL